MRERATTLTGVFKVERSAALGRLKIAPALRLLTIPYPGLRVEAPLAIS